MTEHRFQGYGHPELYKMINSGPGVSASIPVEQGWKQIAATLAQIDGDLHEGLAKMGADWESDASDTAQTALSPLAEWAGFAETGATTMESSARLQGEFIADARKKMPEVVPVTTEKPGLLDIAAGALTGPVGMAHVVSQQLDHERQEAAADNAAAQAVKVMEDYQADSRWNSSTLGEIPNPPQVVIDTPPPGDSGNGSTRVGFTSPTGYTPNGTTTTPSWTSSPTPSTGNPVSPTWTPPTSTPTNTTHVSWTQPPVSPPVSTPPPVTGLPTPAPTPTPTPVPPGGPVYTRPPTTGVPGTKPGGPNPGQNTGQPGGGKGTSGGLRGGLPGAGGGKAFSPMSGSLGSSAQQGVMKPGGMGAGMGSGPGGTAGGPAGAGGAAGRGGAAGAAGRGGAAGVGAGGAHGRGGQGEEDIEHKAADYLVETTDVFGDDRLVAPPVIGGFSE
ncbi:PPE family protein [Lentzea fradiae]|uniref:PPE family protein n=1 Tax=Lentzea fradiae TaxID=200378 RepID=A0A1G7MD20_9PSEU|nr:PPE domain-containing protein [Lentzea fradiae]SDF59545.1 PPE family protein [Lentzea fradiae]